MSYTHAVVFDFDGVLADTEGAHLAAFQGAFAPRGWTLDRGEYFDRYLGYDDADLLRTFARDRALQIDAEDAAAVLADKARRYEERIARGSVLFPAAASAVARLAGHFRIAIASGSLRREILDILQVNGLADLFPVVIGADDVTRGKPSPEPYALAVASLGLPPEAAVAIEDSHWGLASARGAGLRAIGITTSYPASALGAAQAIVDSLDEVTIDLVDRILGVR